MKREKIIFLTEKNPQSTKDWSGIPYFMYKALEHIYDVQYLRGPKLKTVRRVLFHISKIMERVTGRKFVFDYGRITAWLYGRYYNRILSTEKNIKFIFVPAGLTEIGNLTTDFPIVAVGDCSTLQLFDYYPALMNVSSQSRQDVELVERSAFAKCSRVVFSSAWAADFVRKRYGARCFVIPFGANIRESKAPKRERNKDVFRLLLIGVDWQRKGGAIALEIHRRLLNQGIPSHLTIAGMKPSDEIALPNIQFIFIDKDSESGERQHWELLSNSDLLLLPTVADCTPIVIAEAFAAGLPVLATRTGGIPSMIDEGITGFLFGPGDSTAYVDRIERFWRDPQLLQEMSSNCLMASENTFNWKKWAEEMKKLCAPL